MKITTIQLYDDTKKKLSQMKEHPNESYDSVLKRIIEQEDIPDMHEMFKKCDAMKQKKSYSREEVVRISHELRDKR